MMEMPEKLAISEVTSKKLLSTTQQSPKEVPPTNAAVLMFFMQNLIQSVKSSATKPYVRSI